MPNDNLSKKSNKNNTFWGKLTGKSGSLCSLTDESNCTILSASERKSTARSTRET